MTRQKLRREVREHYDLGLERSRLLTRTCQLEFHRTKEIVSRYLTNKRAVVLDVGGGPGAYACWLARLGHTVYLVDPVPMHVKQAREASRAQRGFPVARIALGDARELKFKNGTADIVLLLGPLYHLIERRDRVQSLSEAFRALKRGGLLFAAAISRFASALDGFVSNFIEDSDFYEIVQRDLTDGEHRNPTNRPEYFTTAFFHHPDELRSEIEEAGFELEKLYAVEGLGWLVPNFEKVWNDPVLKARLLAIVKTIETEPTLIGQSAHLLAVGRKTG